MENASCTNGRRQAKIYTYYGVRFTIPQLAASLGCSDQTVRNRFDRHDGDVEAALRGWHGISGPRDLLAILGNTVAAPVAEIKPAEEPETAEATAANDILRTLGYDTEMPVNDTEMPVNDTEMPVNDTEMPVNDTEMPVNDTEMPEPETEMPGNDTEAEGWRQELRKINAAIKMLNELLLIDYLDKYWLENDIRNLKIARSDKFSEHIDWDALAR